MIPWLFHTTGPTKRFGGAFSLRLRCTKLTNFADFSAKSEVLTSVKVISGQRLAANKSETSVSACSTNKLRLCGRQQHQMTKEIPQKARPSSILKGRKSSPLN